MKSRDSITLRPTLLTATALDEIGFMQRLQQAVEGSEDLTGSFKRGHAMISFAESKRHFWSPWMHLEYRSNESQNILARFSPNPSIWTGFVLMYLTLAVLSFFSMILGVSQQIAQQVTWGYYCLPAWIAVGLILWWASKVGQHLAKEEMGRLITFVESCCKAESVNPSEKYES